MISSIGAYYIFREELNKIDIVSLVVGFAGVLLILLPKSDSSGNTIHMSILHIVLIILLPFMMSVLQLLIRKMKNVHYAVINFYYALVSTIGYILWALYEMLIDTSYKEFWPKYFSLRNCSLLLISSVSHVFALVFWTMAF